MRNYLKYSSLKLRSRKGPCDMQGPNFAWAQNLTLTLGDNTIAFKAPRHSPKNAYSGQVRHIDKNNDLVCRSVSESRMPNQNWLELLTLAREWAFYGPWFIGGVSQLQCAAVVITRNYEKADAKNVPESLFHPRAFEYELCKYLTDYYGHKHDNNKADWLAPANWKSLKSLSVFGARFDVAPFHMPNTRDHHIVVPITDKHMLRFSFTFGSWVQATNIRNGQCEFAHVGQERFRIDNTPVLELMESIIQSITITLSDKNQQAYDKVKAENPDLKMAVSETLAPLQWPAES
ncbi:hypothetical protein MARGE09_P3721 [Marinagarivorans cellulosilyticus]|uniref:Uncharacterized protein n=2 Tax=Marinagarivorans cellulosilyticus TaxID=2721545 RepID=A0AAN1WL03_9GAMM|nr:hypothetical protein MARGE09_P3721 [Marinagarivorans cellulosilyticus]